MKKTPVDPVISEAAAAMGKKGGQRGVGKAKARGPEHYTRLAEIRRRNRLKRLKAEKKAA